MKSSVNWSRAPRSPVLFGAALLVFVLAVLWPGFRLAGRLDDTTAALRLVSEQQRQAEIVAGALISVRDRLESFGYVDEPLSEVRTGVGELDALLRTLTGAASGRAPSRPVRYGRSRAPTRCAATSSSSTRTGRSTARRWHRSRRSRACRTPTARPPACS